MITSDKATKPVMEQEAVTVLRHRGTVSLDEERSEVKVEKRKGKMPMRAARSCERSDSVRVLRSERLAEHGLDDAPPFASSSTATTTSDTRGRWKGKGSTKEVWRRKEREWSGEWNVRDMGEVTKALRELKSR